ncbi:cation-translocating P-type ATPase [Pseudorhodoferax sp. Leaf267]|uniref:heavy metal translocating P-type ATPase n=1 Tax=Pseudorhodoferax sp. Leaf267 TaxID=1736316 RepID=UPI000701F3CC|nr:cation-translocating P-type ATPase [Pseudorhodoferax sp. Leaf267]KQP22789.1 ATPase P [Pseudorhodoferax sp. Leaf267]
MPASPLDLTQAPTPAGLEWIDDAAEWPAFSRPSAAAGEGVWESSMAVEGMTCASCALTVEAALRAVPGVLAAEVGAASRRARVVWRAGSVRPSQWLAAVRAAGYRGVPLADLAVRTERRRAARQMLWRWLVAGLCMMQVMMYAWPAYVAAPGEISADAQALMRWASWVLSLPVMLFSCGPFLRAALRDARQRRLGMDTPVTLGILITFAVSSAGTFEPDGLFGAEVYFDSLNMFVFFLLSSRWLEARLRDRTGGALDMLLQRLPDGVERERADGRREQVAAHRVAVGNVLHVKPGEAFVADAVILEGETLADEALLSGESRPMPRGPGATVLAGSYNLAAAVRVRVTAVGEATRFAQIAALMDEAARSRPRLAQLADRIARPFLLAVLLAAAGAALYWWPQDPGHALMVAVAVLVVTCPCALSLATPAAMLAAAGALARRGVLVRRLQALEALARVDTVVFDKTGTLTHDALALGAVRTRAGVDRAQALAMAAALAARSLHPASRALAAAGRDTGNEDLWQVTGLVEEPGAGVRARLWRNGWPWPGELRLGSAAHCGIHADGAEAMTIWLADAQGMLAAFVLHEDLRADAQAAIARLQAMGLQVQLLSGDAGTAVARAASVLGIAEARGGCSPQRKLQALRGLQQRGRHTAMVGDGLNDGPVLAGADVSFAFGQAVPLAQAQADFVVPGGALMAIADTFALARRTLAVVRQNLAWAAVYNAVSVPLAVAGLMPAWLAGLGMAASSLLVVLNALRLSLALPAPEPAPLPVRVPRPVQEPG